MKEFNLIYRTDIIGYVYVHIIDLSCFMYIINSLFSVYFVFMMILYLFIYTQ